MQREYRVKAPTSLDVTVRYKAGDVVKLETWYANAHKDLFEPVEEEKTAVEKPAAVKTVAVKKTAQPPVKKAKRK